MGESLKQFPEEPIMLNVGQVAYMLQIGLTQAWGLINRKELPSVRIGRSVRIPRVQLEAWIQQRITESSTSVPEKSDE